MLLLLLSVRAYADAPGPQVPASPVFDQAMAAQVFTAAFTFMAPRTLDVVPLPQMTLWGLRGITALDPALVPVLHDTDMALLGPNGTLVTVRLPAVDDLAGWGGLAAAVGAAASRNSDTLRHAGTQGLITSFFEEVFNHLDPYSRYVPPAAATTDRDRRNGQAGIGVTLSGHLGSIAIAAIVADSPAADGGLHAGDRLIAIDGASTARETAGAALIALGGDDGAPVALTLRSRGGGSHVVTLQRALIPADTVFASRDHDLVLLRVSGFTASTAARLRQELGRLLDQKPEPAGIVFDLRGNRGGLLRQAVQAADLLLSSGTIATTAGRAPEADHAWAADGEDLSEGLPVVVMVDGRSASAAEVLAAALSDNGRAVVVGSATLGKGLVQTITTLPDGGELFVTWSRVLAPHGWPLQGLGVLPQVCTSLGAEPAEAQLTALGGGVQPMQAALARHRAARSDMPLTEMLLIRDACPAALGRDADMDAARFLIGNPVAYATALAPL